MESPRIRSNLLEMPTSGDAQRRLRTPVRFYWEQQPLREGLMAITAASGLAIWIDRRIDPSQAVSYIPDDSTTSTVWPAGSLGARLDEIASKLGLEAGLIENVLYIGPAGETARLQRAAMVLQDELHRRSPELSRQQKNLGWQELTTPQQLLGQLAREWKIEIAAELPHDLMHAGQLPQPSHLATQLVLVGGGFGLEPEMVGPNNFVLKPLADSTMWVASYPKDQVHTQEWPRLRGEFPGSELRPSGQEYHLTGPTDFHLASLLPTAPRGKGSGSGNADRRSAAGNNSSKGRAATGRAATGRAGKGRAGKVTVWSFAIDKAPAEAIVSNLAAGIGLQIRWSDRCTLEHKSQLLSLKVNEADLDQLLTQVCEAAGLRYTRDGNNVELFPK